MMDTAIRIAFEELCDRRIVSERRDQLHLGVRQRDEHRRNPVSWLRLRIGHMCSKALPIHARCGCDVSHCDGDMIESAEHRQLPCLLFPHRQEKGTVIPSARERGTSASYSTLR